jgi:hypothetical protein
MPAKNRYPLIRIRSKNDLAKRISYKNFPFDEALALINNVLKNHSKYWHDVKSMSKPDDDKYVRSCKNTQLDKLLKLINDKVLAPYDFMVPEFIFGGVSGQNHIKAVKYLLGSQRKRSKLSLDIKRFFEQNSRDRVYHFLYYKCECGKKASNIIADLCCVPYGQKGSTGNKVLARGFSTSTRLALWCNMDLFLKVYWTTKKVLKNKDSRIAIFIDDIGITASKVGKDDLEMLYDEIADIFKNYDQNQKLLIHEKDSKKTDIKSYTDKNIEHLGLRMGRNKISVNNKTRAKQRKIKKELGKDNLSSEDKRKLISRKASLKRYVSYVKKSNEQ